MDAAWRAKIERELATAETAAARGNAGMARVAARRAGGWAAQAFLAAYGQAIDSTSVLDQLRGLSAHADLPPRVHEIAGHLLTIKQKDHLQAEAYFPLNVDLVAEARELVDLLHPDNNKTGG